MNWILSILLILGLWAGIAFAQPWTPEAIWSRAGAGAQSRYGGYVYALGDQNDDGYSDWIVIAEGWGDPGQSSERLVELFLGGNPPSNSPYKTFRGIPDSTYNVMAYPLGDINGDHIIDWGRSMAFRSGAPRQLEVFFGGALDDTIPVAVFAPVSNRLVGSLGDFNGDGFGDMFIYSFSADYTTVYYGGAMMDTTPDWLLYSRPFESQHSLVLSVGNVNGDGYSDFVTGDLNNRIAYIYFGSANPDTIPRITIENLSPSHIELLNDLNGDGSDEVVARANSQTQVRFGGNTVSKNPDVLLNFSHCLGEERLWSLGDVNGDGYNDMAHTNEDCLDDPWGIADIYLGYRWLNPNPATQIFGGADYGLFGIRSCAALGDVNGDGINDFMLGAWSEWNDFRGRAVIFSGDTTIHVAAELPRPELPAELEVSVFPNPFNAQTTFKLTVPAGAQGVDMHVFNLLGQVVFSERLSLSGDFKYRFSADLLTSGLYFLQVQSGVQRVSTKLVVLK